MLTISPESIRQALDLSSFDAAGAQKMMAPNPRSMVRPPGKHGRHRTGAVLLMFYQKDSGTHIVLIRRHKRLKYHPGQISFPGGRQEKGEELLQTALRETCEEVGTPPENLLVLGSLHPVYIPPSDFCVHAFAAWHDGDPLFSMDAAEVEEILEVPVETFFDSALRKTELRRSADKAVSVPYFALASCKVWGATAMILSEMVERLKAVSS